MIKIGARLRRIRKAKGMSQRDVRKATGLVQCYLSRIENDYHDPSLATLEKIARAFSMEFCDFLYQLTCSRFRAEIPEMDDVVNQDPLQTSTQPESQTDLQTDSQTSEQPA